MDERERFYEECDCGSDTFRIKVVPFGDCGTDHVYICSECGEEIGGVINDPLNEAQ